MIKSERNSQNQNNLFPRVISALLFDLSRNTTSSVTRRLFRVWKGQKLIVAYI